MSFGEEQREKSSLFTGSVDESLDGEKVFKSYHSTEGPDGGPGGGARGNGWNTVLLWIRGTALRALVMLVELLRMVRNQILKSFCNKKITKEESNVQRDVYFNHPEENVGFPNNYISTGKYTLLNFVPKILFEQFRKLFNLYFVMIIILQQIPGVSPTGRFTTIVPLSIVLSIAAIKEVIEDLKRHYADRKINRKRIEVLRGGTTQTVLWKQVLAGDIVRVNNRENFPADLVCLASSEKDGICYIQTANLDGEINLKLRRSHIITKSKKPEDFHKLKGLVNCEGPNSQLYEFSGNLELHGERFLPILPENILLRGAQLRNTEYVYGFVVYTGHESKLLMNTHSTPLKRSTMDRTIDKLVIILFGILIVLSTLSAVADTVWSCTYFDRETNENRHFYLPANTSCVSGAVLGYFILSICQFMILYNNFVPISLVVTVEIVKFIQAFWISQDMEMYNPVADVPTKARTSNLNEELGQVRYIFSDKTGTLTCNKMEFKKCLIQDVVYE